MLFEKIKIYNKDGFAEYLAVNLSPGKYPFFSIADSKNIKGKMTILP